MQPAEPQPLPDRPEAAEPAVLAERRARRAEHAEQELRTRLADAERRVAELEHAELETTALRERLAERAARDARMADLAGRSAAALRTAREALDREILARQAAETALTAERAAREAAQEAVSAERAARDAVTAALAAERARVATPAAGSPAGPAPTMPGIPATGFSVPTAPAPVAGDTDADELIAGLARAAERLRAQAPQAAGDPPSLPAIPLLASIPQPTARPAPGALAPELERALRNAR
ncbi:unannotated protein [freshwater metagenome]|uniref:Unannotated protein n=1 Tax=freshwater metagenome TaxID=449393 RepID=A0A6J7J9G5_9ZZZZ|nr:hypothetical protein [Actinomycetota bacterium]